MGSRITINLFLKPSSPALSGKAFHMSSTDITDYRYHSKPKMESMHFYGHVSSCILPVQHFFEHHIKHYRRNQIKAQVIWVTLFLQYNNKEMILWAGLSQSNSG